MNLETILVVDDEGIVLEFCDSVLARVGYHVLRASSGEQALKICGDRIGAIDLVLVDVVMAGMSGVELVDRLNHQKQTMRIAMMSGYSPEEVKKLIAAGGADYHFFWKPFQPKSFLQTIRNLLDRPPANQSRATGAAS